MMVWSDLPLDVCVLSGSYVWIILRHADFHVIAVYVWCLMLVGYCLWLDRWLSAPLQRKDTRNIAHYLRASANSGSWYAILPLLTVANIPAFSSYEREGPLQEEIVLLGLSLLGTFLSLIPRLTGEWNVTCSVMMLVLSVAEYGVLVGAFYIEGVALCLTGVVIQVISALILHLCLMWGRGVFSLGEGIVLSQLYTLFLYRLGSAAVQGFWVQLFDVSLEDEVNHFAAVVFVGVTMVVLVLLLYCQLLSRQPGPWCFYSLLSAIALTVVLPSLYYSLHTNPVTWLVLYLVEDSNRLMLFVSWMLLSLLAVVTVLHQGSQANTGTRKYFHGLVVAVYVPGLLLDTSFLSLAAVVALGVLTVLEAVRVLNIPPLGNTVHNLFKAFCDEKDEGAIIVSHIYLLVGLSLPLWLSQSSKYHVGQDICLFSGVISLGVGDTAASVGGSMFGRHRWPGSKKTIEGTTIAVLCQLVAIVILFYLGMGVSQSVWTVVIIVVLTSVLEGVTAQIDNLILPLFMFSLFTATPYQM